MMTTADTAAAPPRAQRVGVRFGATLSANVVRAVVSFVTGVLIAKGLGPAGYGDLNFLLASFIAFNQLLEMGTASAFYTFVAERGRGMRFFLVYGVWLALQFTGPLLVLGVLVPDALSARLWVGSARDLVLLAFAANFLVTRMWPTVSQLGEALRKTVLVQAASVAQAVVHLGLVAAALYGEWLSPRSVLALLVVENVVAIVLLAPRLLRDNVTRHGGAPESAAAVVREFASYCAPLVVFGAVGFVYNFADRWLLQHFGGSAQQGFFAIGQQLSNVSLLATSSILMVFWKEIAEAVHADDHDRVVTLYRVVSRALYSTGAWVSCLLIPYSGPILARTVGERFEGASLPFALMLLYPIHQSLGQILSTFFYARRDTRRYVQVGLVTMLVSVPVGYLLLAPATAAIPGLGLGAVGLSMKMVVLQIGSVNLLAYVAARSGGPRYEFRFQAVVLAVLLALGWSARLASEALLDFTGVPYHDVASFVLAGVLYALGSASIFWRWPELVGISASRAREIAGQIFGRRHSRHDDDRQGAFTEDSATPSAGEPMPGAVTSPGMITVVLASPLVRLPTVDRWVYLGKDGARRAAFAARLGSERRVRLGRRVYETAVSIRDEFIRAVADVGRSSGDGLTWWASRLASRSPYQTDLHLLSSFACLFDEMLSEARRGDATTGFVIEDAWLFRLLAARYRARGVEFRGAARTVIILTKCIWLLRGIAARAKLIVETLQQRRAIRSAGSPGMPTREPDAWIYSYVEPRLFLPNDSIDDPYLPGLGAILARQGVEFGRVTGLMLPASLRGRLHVLVRSSTVLLAGVSSGEVLRAATRYFRLAPRARFSVGGMDLSALLEREVWDEVRQANLAVNLLYFHAFRRFFAHARGRALFFFYEGLPWERMMALAKRHAESSMTLVGYQHSSVPALLLNYFPAAQEWPSLPAPEYVVTNGPLHLRILREAGYPEGALVDGGALRYPKAHSWAAEGGGGARDAIVFVALSISPFISRELLELLLAHEASWDRHGLRFHVRAHPDTPFERIGLRPIGGTRVMAAVTGAWDVPGGIDALLYSNTAMGLEAVLRGVPAFAYIPETAICCDVALDRFTDAVVPCHSGDLEEKITQFAHARRTPAAPAAVSSDAVFGIVDERRWAALALGGATR